MRRFAMLLGVALLAGLIAGSYGPSTTEAIHRSRHMWFNPPVEADGYNAYLTNGWGHSSDGISLDWDDVVQPNRAYDRAWAFSYDSAPTVQAKGVIIFGGPDYGTCTYRIWVEVRDEPSGVVRLRIGHIHAKQPQLAQVFYVFSNAVTWNGGAHIANMATASDYETCSWTAPHIHETHQNVAAEGIQTNTGLYPSNFTESSLPYANDSINTWTREAWWTP